MKFLSVCSGIEAASVAWNPLGWKAVAFAEIEPFPCAVLAHHYPDVPNWGDMTKYQEWPDADFDVLCGGTPCQSFSVAGLRKGLADPRGNLMLTFGAIAARYRPRWLVWENVPGVLSSNGGRDFGSFLGLLGELGYGFAYRVLDAQFFGVPQRRRRVFVVGCAGNWRSAAAVLFERHGLSGHPAPSREKGQRPADAIAASSFIGGAGGRPEGAAPGHFIADAAPTLSARTKGGGGLGTDFDCDGGLIAGTLDASYGRLQGCSGQDANHGHSHLVPVAFNWQGGGTQTTLGYDPDADHTGALHVGQVPAIAFGTKEFAQDAGDVSPPLRAMGSNKNHPNGGGQIGVAFSITPSNSNKDYNARQVDKAQALTAGGNRPSARGGDLIAGMQVRRLIPEECEALQGFRRGYTAVPYRGKPAADGPRYKALGNSWAVPCARWIGERINQVKALTAIAAA